MLQPYSDRPSTKGTLIYNTSDLLAGRQTWKAGVTRSRPTRLGTPRTARSSTFTSRRAAQAADRFRVEHVQILSEQDLPRFAKLGVIPSMQTTHCASDLGYADARLGARANLSYAWRALKDTGVDVLPLGSDFPTAGTIPPLLGLHAGITRERPDGTPRGGWHPEERLTPLEALRGYSATLLTRHYARRSWAPSSPAIKQTLLYSLPIR